MRRGISYVNPDLAVPGMRSVPPGYRIDGIPVRFDARSVDIADARGIWPWKWIVVGPKWLRLTLRQQTAVLWHEAWHCRRLHLEARIALLPLCWTRFVHELAEQQEFRADAHAAARGYAREMIEVIAHYAGVHAPFHPPPGLRVAVLRCALKTGEA